MFGASIITVLTNILYSGFLEQLPDMNFCMNNFHCLSCCPAISVTRYEPLLARTHFNIAPSDSLFQDCLEAEAFKGGEYVLREGDPLGTDAKFYLVESGTVHCLKSYEVRPPPALPSPLRRGSCSSSGFRHALQGGNSLGVHTYVQSGTVLFTCGSSGRRWSWTDVPGSATTAARAELSMRRAASAWWQQSRRAASLGRWAW